MAGPQYFNIRAIHPYIWYIPGLLYLWTLVVVSVNNLWLHIKVVGNQFAENGMQ